MTLILKLFLEVHCTEFNLQVCTELVCDQDCCHYGQSEGQVGGGGLAYGIRNGRVSKDHLMLYLQCRMSIATALMIVVQSTSIEEHPGKEPPPPEGVHSTAEQLVS